MGQERSLGERCGAADRGLAPVGGPVRTRTAASVRTLGPAPTRFSFAQDPDRQGGTAVPPTDFLRRPTLGRSPPKSNSASDLVHDPGVERLAPALDRVVYWPVRAVRHGTGNKREPRKTHGRH